MKTLKYLEQIVSLQKILVTIYNISKIPVLQCQQTATTATGQLRTASGERSGHFERGRGLRTSSTALIDYVSLVLLASLVEIIVKLPTFRYIFLWFT